MPSVYDPSSAVLPSEEEARAIEPRLMFSRTTIRAVYIGVIAAGIGLDSGHRGIQDVGLVPAR